MAFDFNRSEERKKARVHAFVADLADIFQVKCVIRDLSRNGCRLVTSRAHDLPKIVRIVPEGTARPLKGYVVWRRANEAGVCFEHGCNAQQRAEIASAEQALLIERGNQAARPLRGYAERLKSTGKPA